MNDSVKISACDRFLPPGDGLYVNKKSGLVHSKGQMSGSEVLEFWNNQVFGSLNNKIYDSSLPFSQSRLAYCWLSFKTALTQGNLGIEFDNDLKIADFCSGKGYFYLMMEKFPLLACKHIALVEASPSGVQEAKNLARRKIEIHQSSIGLKRHESLPEDIDVGFLNWSLCNMPNTYDALIDLRRSIKDGGLLVVSESSRILVPFKKSLHDYLNKEVPSDIHPFHFSRNTLSQALFGAGFEVIYENRWFDSDVLMLYAKKLPELPNTIDSLVFDDYQSVIHFFERWAEMSDWLA